MGGSPFGVGVVYLELVISLLHFIEFLYFFEMLCNHIVNFLCALNIFNLCHNMNLFQWHVMCLVCALNIFCMK